MNQLIIFFLNLVMRENAAKGDVENRARELEQIRNTRPLTDDEESEIKRIHQLLHELGQRNNPELCDPLYVGIRDLFNANPGLLGVTVPNHDQGQIFPEGKGPPDPNVLVRIALTLGLIEADQVALPRVVVQDQKKKKAANNNAEHKIVADINDATAYATLSRAFFGAIGEAQGYLALARNVLPFLAIEGEPARFDGAAKPTARVSTLEFAKVVRCLAAKNITATEPQLRRRVNECLNTIQAVGGDQPLADISIALPNFDQATTYQLVPDHIRLMGSMMCAAMLEELKVFQVVDNMLHAFLQGKTSFGRGRAGEMLYKYWREAPNRLDEMDRRNAYALTIGPPGGNANGGANTEFNTLWTQFLSSVTTLVRQSEVDNLLRAGIPAPVSQQMVRKAAFNLAANLTAHGYGGAYFIAVDVQKQIGEIIKLLSDPDVLLAHNAHDMWQVIDQRATLELGGALNSARYRTLATCGAIITSWLANNTDRLSRPFGNVIDVSQLRSANPPTAGQKATSQPTDYDMVNACQLTAVELQMSETQMDQISSTPIKEGVTTSRPIEIPQIAKDMLEQAGVVGLGNGTRISRY